MRVYTSQSAKTVFGNAGASKIRKLYSFCCADHDVFDLALAIDKYPYLPSGLIRDLGHLTGQFRGDDRIGSDSPRTQFLDPLELIVF